MDATTSIEATVSSVASKSSTGGAVTGVMGMLTNDQFMATSGVVVAVLGFVVNLIFQIRRDRREQYLQDAQIAAIKTQEK